MTTIERILRYQSLASADVASLFDADEMQEYLKRRLPISKKPDERTETVIEDKK